MSGPHSLRARQRNDRDLAANEQKLEVLAVKATALNTEILDLQTEQRALLALGAALRDAGGPS